MSKDTTTLTQVYNLFVFSLFALWTSYCIISFKCCSYPSQGPPPPGRRRRRAEQHLLPLRLAIAARQHRAGEDVIGAQLVLPELLARVLKGARLGKKGVDGFMVQHNEHEIK